MEMSGKLDTPPALPLGKDAQNKKAGWNPGPDFKIWKRKKFKFARRDSKFLSPRPHPRRTDYVFLLSFGSKWKCFTLWSPLRLRRQFFVLIGLEDE
jgi:hypothetical protein